MTSENQFPPQPEADGEDLVREDPAFDAWRTPRGDLQAGREPGLIDLNRYQLGHASSGIATFLGRPAALTPADLRAAEVDVAILGAGLDHSLGMRGAAFGPRALRAHDMYMPTVQSGFPHTHVMVDAMEELTICDYGDAAVDWESTERSIEPIRGLVREVVETGTIPFIVGGDHALMYPDVAALADVYGKGKVGVIHFDSHYDAASIGLGHWLTHGTPVRRLIVICHARKTVARPRAVRLHTRIERRTGKRVRIAESVPPDERWPRPSTKDLLTVSRCTSNSWPRWMTSSAEAPPTPTRHGTGI